MALDMMQRMEDSQRVNQPLPPEQLAEIYQTRQAMQQAIQPVIQLPAQVYTPIQMYTDQEQSAMQELVQLLERSDRAQDPRVKVRIEQLLTNYPTLLTLVASKTEV